MSNQSRGLFESVETDSITMHILSFDIEEWYLMKIGESRQVKSNELDLHLNHILESLDTTGSSATFFCLGKMATHFPEVVKKILAHGHEIGSHSDVHKWINKMSESEFREDTKRAVCSLEDLIGEKIRSFRAPAFSIGESNKWAFEVLAEFGIENDASIFPGCRDFGGFPTFKEQTPCIIEYNGVQIYEYPIPMAKLPIIGKEVAFSGGGYFRLFPYWFVDSNIKNLDYSMSYFHIEDLLSEREPLKSKQKYEEYYGEAGPLIKRFSRYLKSNIGRGGILKKFNKHLTARQYTSIKEARSIQLPQNKIII